MPPFQTPSVSEEEAIARMLNVANEVADFCFQHAAEVDYEGGFPLEEFARLGEAGLLRVALGREQGGLGLGEPGRTLPLLRLLKTIGRGNLAVGRVYEGHINALQLIQTYGSPAQRARYAEEVCREGRVFAVWNTEAADGVKLVPMDDGQYRLEGSKTFASGAGYVTRPFANGALPDGSWQMLIVPMERVATTTDPSWWKPLGMRASASYKVDFSGVVLDETDLIGKPGDYTRQPWFSGGAIRFAAVQLGGAEALLDATRRFLRDTGRTDDPYQRTRLGEMAIKVESGMHWLRGAADVTDRFGQPDGPDADTVVAYANMMRTAIEGICLEVLNLAERSVGARGLLRPHPFERISRDLTLYLRQPAPDAALASVGRFVLDSEKVAGELWTHERQ